MDNETNFLAMSDEEAMKMDFSIPDETTTEKEEGSFDDQLQESGQQDEGTPALVEEESAKAEGTGAADVAESGTDQAAEGDVVVEGEVEVIEQADATEPDYKAAYEQLMAPFKANGREMQVKSVDDALTLMKQGANYNKKMAALKPGLKVLKTLENNGLLDEAKINYLIDLDKKNPEAIAKLVKESGIDPLDMGTDEQANYQPNSYTVDDKEMALDDVLSEIHDSPHYKETMSIVGDKWDAESRRLIVENPAIIAALNGQVETGVYAKIAQEMERERMLGRLDGIPDVMAYRQIGMRMEAEGAFKSQPAAAITPAPIPAKKPDPELQQRRKAAAVTKTKAPSAAPDLNPLNMTDEEFEQSFNSTYR